MDHIQSNYCASGSEEQRSEGHGCLLGVDEIRPEILKASDIVGLSGLTRLSSITWRSGTVPA